MKNILYISAFIFFCLLSYNFIDNPNDLSKDKNNFQITLKFNNKTYEEFENIWIEVNIKNTSSMKDSVSYLSNAEILKYLDIRNNASEKVMYDGTSTDYLTTPYQKFLPGEEIKFRMQINKAMGFSKIDEEGSGKYFPSGNYKAIFHLADRNKNIVNSNEVNFSVNRSNSSVSEKFMKILNKMFYLKGSVFNDDVVTDANEFIKEYKETIFSSQMQYYLIYYKNLRVSDTNENFSASKILQEIDNYIEKNTESYDNIFLISVYVHLSDRYYKSSNKSANYLNNLKNKYPNSKITEFIEEFKEHEKSINN